jgi:hypothetical protein
MAFCTSMAHRTVYTTLRNCIMLPSPVPFRLFVRSRGGKALQHWLILVSDFPASMAPLLPNLRCENIVSLFCRCSLRPISPRA